MKSIKEMTKSERGTFDFCSDRIVYFCKWNDNSIVNIACNFTSHIPTETVKRGVKKKADARITQPKLIKQCNLGMGGVDVMDQLLGTYWPMIWGKKWYWPLVINAINVSVVAAWRIHCNAVTSPMTHLEFCREIAICLLKSPMEVQTKVISDLTRSIITKSQQPKDDTTRKIHGTIAKNATFDYIQAKEQFVLICFMEICNQWTLMSHVQQMWLFDF